MVRNTSSSSLFNYAYVSPECFVRLPVRTGVRVVSMRACVNVGTNGVYCAVRALLLIVHERVFLCLFTCVLQFSGLRLVLFAFYALHGAFMCGGTCACVLLACFLF